MFMLSGLKTQECDCIEKMKWNEKSGFTLIELMITSAIIGTLAAIAIPNFIAYRNKSFCVVVENDATNIVASIADYFSVPSRNNIAKGDQAFEPTTNSYTISASNPTVAITITVTDASGRCPADYTAANPVSPQGDGWINGSIYQKVMRN